MKTFKRLMSFALALLMLASVIPSSVISARAAPTETEMMDNYVLDAMEYLGFNIEGFKKTGMMYKSATASFPFAPDIRYDDDSWGDNHEGNLRGFETTTDPETGATIPDVATFKKEGLVCASYLTYYYLNYLPNIKGEDTSLFKDEMKVWKDKSGLSWQGAQLWRYALEKIVASEEQKSVTRIYYAKYNAKDKDAYGNPVSKIPDNYDLWEVGDIVTFGYEKADGTEGYSHVGIYLGEKNEYHWVSHCVSRSYKDANNKTHNVSIVFGTIEDLYETGGPKPASIVTGVYRIKDTKPYDDTGKIEVYKKDPNGKNLAGAKFSATNTTTGEIFFIGPTDSDGYAMRKDLPFGTYKVVETAFPAGYSAYGETEWIVTLNEDTPNGTCTVNAVNQQNSGPAKIYKKSTNGGTVEGWLFTIKDSDGNVVAENLASGADGLLVENLPRGTYYVTETGHKTISAADLSKYWVMDTSTKTIVIDRNYQSEPVTFTNQYLGRGKLVIYKTNNQGEPLAGAVFTATETTTGKTYTFPVTDSNGYTCLTDIPYGYYKIVETAYPAWHTNSGETEWYREVSEKDPNPIALEIKNTIITGPGTIRKTSTNGGTVEGWLFTIRDSKGKVVHENVPSDTNGELVVHLMPGTYSVTETGHKSMTSEELENWEMDTRTQTLTIRNDLSSEPVTFANKLLTGSVEIIKTTTNGGTVEGWLFTIKDSEGNVVAANQASGADGKISVNDLIPGTYTVIETGHNSMTSDQLAYWKMDSAPQTVTVKGNKTASVTFENQFYGKGKIKKTATNGGTVEGWLFTIKDSSGKVIKENVSTDSNGEFLIEDLVPGTYTVTETGHKSLTSDQLSYWRMDATPKTVTIKAGETELISFSNELWGKIQVKKTTNTGGDLQGWKFNIFKVNGTYVETIITDSNGIATSSALPAETYYVKEVDGPGSSEGWFTDITASGNIVYSSNLLLNSGLTSTTSHWTGTNGTGIAIATVNRKIAMQVTPSTSTKSIGYATQTVQKTGTGKYTLSAEIYVTKAYTLYLAVWEGSTSSTALETATITLSPNKWNHVEYTFTLNSEYKNLVVGFGGAKNAGNFAIRQPKFVYGDTATPWTSDRTVSVKAGEIATYNVKNVKGGKIAVQKTTNTGLFLSGWTFTVSDSDGTLIETLVTDANGYAVTSKILPPDVYTVKETGNNDPNFDPEYWEMDKAVTRKVTISANSYEEVHTEYYTNKQMGVGHIIKTATNGGTVEGWLFTIKDASGKIVAANQATDSNGELLIDLEPGTYTVTETGHKSMTDAQKAYWKMDSTPKTLTVKAGETASVSFENQFYGKGKIVKTTTNGGTVEGWLFTVKDASGKVVAENVATNSSGVIIIDDLAPGSYTVTETGHKSMTDAQKAYWKMDSAHRTLTVKAGETASVTFENQFYGKAEIIKTTTNGGTKVGWLFTIKDASGKVVAENVATDANGKYHIDELAPGTYTVTETGHSTMTDAQKAYWKMDSTPRTLTVKAGETASVTFENQFLGKGKIIKTTTNGGTKEGWLFTVKDASGKVVAENVPTDSSGVIIIDDLAPGNYTVIETGHNSLTSEQLSYWKMDATPKTLTIKAGEIASVNFYNQLWGQGKIIKTATNGGTLEGWLFTIKDVTNNVVAENVATNSKGELLIELAPGSYTVTETGHKSMTDAQKAYWKMDNTPKTLTVKAGKTASVTFENQFYGKGKIVKTATNGGTVEGWLFTVKDASGKVVAENVATNSSGVIIIDDLAPGNYTVIETGHNSLTSEQLSYWKMDSAHRTLTVKAGETASVSFENQFYGKGKIVKTATNGGTVEGWLFTVKDASGKVIIQNQATNAKGELLLSALTPGTYTVIETGHTTMTDAQKAYWKMDSAPRTLTVKAGETASVTFENQFLGKGKIVKTATNGGTVEGWLFTIKDAANNVVAENVATNSIGELLIDLAPGNYTVTETGHNSMTSEQLSYWKMDNTPRTLTVKAGETASVTFENQLMGKIQVKKATNTGGNLDGWVFEIKDANNNVVDTITTDTNGAAESKLLNPGSYTITEVNGPNGLFGNENWFYDISETNGTVTVIANNTVVHDVTNIKGGKIKVQKATNTNMHLNGWLFEIRNSAGDLIATLETNETGYAETVTLEPGTYTVTEIGNSQDWFDPDLWVMDETPERTVVITADVNEVLPPVEYTNIEKGFGRIIKETNTGNDRGGWIFGIYTSADCNPDSLIETVTSAMKDDSKNEIIEGQATFCLAPGTYFVKEIDSVDGRFESDAWIVDSRIQEIQIRPNEETVVSFYNEITEGHVTIAKKTTNGGTVIGWQFSIVGIDNDFNEIVTITEEINGVGILTTNLKAGTYTITEIGHITPTFDMTYWVMDVQPKTVTIEVEQIAYVEFINQFKGGIEIEKTLEDPTSGTVDGWTFLIEKLQKDDINGSYTVESSFTETTDANGKISSIVEPGTYRITEILDEYSPWAVVGDNPKIIVVVAGQHTEVPFVNRLLEGKIEIHKVNAANSALSGATFLLEWSEDGITWTPVVYSDSVVKGGCTNENLVNGTLTTKKDGVITFSGLHPMMQYRVTETNAPDGYLLLADYVHVGALPADTLEVYKTVVNSRGYVTPQTGAFGTTNLFAGLMLAFMTLAMSFIAGISLILTSNPAVKKKYFMKGRNPMKKFTRIFTLLMALCLTISMAAPAFAATADTATIDPDAKGSIELYKYDMTAATEAGVFEQNSFVSTGTPNEIAEEALAPYAIQGVVFNYHKIADITTYSVTETAANGEHIVQNLYAMPCDQDNYQITESMLMLLGLSESDAYPVEDMAEDYLYFTSDVLITALREALATNASVVKDALMQFHTFYGSPAFAETDKNGYAKVSDLDLGLYIISETYVPEQVKVTTAPFFVSVPSTSIDGTEWNYDLTFYPKNETDYPNLDKKVREDAADTGKHNGTTNDITDGYFETATGSDGDVMNYQVLSDLPTITSASTYLTCYSFLDTLSKGIEYNKNDVKIEWFKTPDCNAEDLIATWTETDETKKFTVTYGTADNDATTMLIEMTAAGLNEINTSKAVFGDDSIYTGYSDCTIRITYSATVNSNADVVYGEGGNPNEVELTWKRTNTNYYDTLNDCCHVYTYGIDLTKKFSDELGNFENVNFVMKNTTDNYWVVATLDEEAGIYYVDGHVENEEDATVFVPTEDGSIFVLGLEDDTYVITETQTDAGYVLLRDAITVVITAANEGELCETCGANGVVASATVNAKEVTMIENDGSANAVVTLTVMNNRGFDNPQTGDEGTLMLTVCGVMLVVSCCGMMALLLFGTKKKNEQ